MELEEIMFARTIWADKQLAKICPGHNIQRIDEILAGDDTEKQFEFMQKMILILHEAYDRREKFYHPEHEPLVLTMEMLDQLNEDELVRLSNLAFADFNIDAEVTVETEKNPKKKDS